MRVFGAILICWLAASAALAQAGVEEIVVTARSAEGARPGTYLRKTGDFILLRVR